MEGWTPPPTFTGVEHNLCTMGRVLLYLVCQSLQENLYQTCVGSPPPPPRADDRTCCKKVLSSYPHVSNQIAAGFASELRTAAQEHRSREARERRGGSASSPGREPRIPARTASRGIPHRSCRRGTPLLYLRCRLPRHVSSHPAVR